MVLLTWVSGQFCMDHSNYGTQADAITRATAAKPDITEPRRLALKWDPPCLIPFTKNDGRHLPYRDPDFPAPPGEGVPHSR